MGESAEARIQDQNGREASGRTLSGGGQEAGRRHFCGFPWANSQEPTLPRPGVFSLLDRRLGSAKHLPELREAGEKTGRSVWFQRKRRATEARLRSLPRLFSPAQKRCLLTESRLGQSQVEHLGRDGSGLLSTDHINQGFYSKPKGNITLAYGLFKLLYCDTRYCTYHCY